LVIELMTTATAGTTLTVTGADEAWQPFVSVTVTEYIPLEDTVTDCVV
jgi:hypothetical protein